MACELSDTVETISPTRCPENNKDRHLGFLNIKNISKWLITQQVKNNEEIFILTVAETPVINWISFGDFISRFSLILKLKSGFIDPNQCCNERQYRYDNIHLSTVLHCWDEKEGMLKEKKKQFPISCIKNCGSMSLNLALFPLIFNTSVI